MTIRDSSLSPAFLWQVLRDTGNGFIDDCALRLSAALSYYSIFSMAPLLIIALGVSGAIFGEEAARGQIYLQLRGYLGAQAAASVQSMVESTHYDGKGPGAALLGFAVLLIGASGVFGQLKDALNTVWRVKPRAGHAIWGFIRDRLLSFGMVLTIGFLLLMSLVVTTALTAFSHYVRGYLPVPDFLWAVVNIVISVIVSSALFASIFKVLPDVRLPWRMVGLGAVVTGLLFEVGKFLLAFYLGRESTASSYGAAGSVILLLLWIYYASAILLFGAEFTRAYAHASGVPVPPDTYAEPIAVDDRPRQGME